MDAALAGLVGVGLGAVISSVTTVWIEHRRRDHEDARDERHYQRDARNRFLTERLPAYKATTAAATVLRESAPAAVIAAMLGIAMGEEGPYRDHGSVIWDREADLESRIDEALLLAGDQVARLLEQLRTDAVALRDATILAIHNPPAEGRPAEVDRHTKVLSESITRFAEDARVELQS
jgi:hypothetical protein